nr:TPA_asm: RNA-dependent RNA polymerase [forcipomyiae 2 virus]
MHKNEFNYFHDGFEEEFHEEITLEYDDFTAFDYDELSANQEPPKLVRESCSVDGRVSSAIFQDEIKIIMELKLEDIEKLDCKRHSMIKRKFESYAGGVKLLTDVVKDPISFIQKQLLSKLNRLDYMNVLEFLLSNQDVWKYQLVNFMEPMIKGGMTTTEEVTSWCDGVTDKIYGKRYLLIKDFARMKEAEFIKDEICFKNIKLGEFYNFRQVLVERDITIFENTQHGTLVCSTPILMTALDLMQQRFPLVLYWHIADVLDKYPGYSIAETGIYLLSEFESLRSTMGNDICKFIKAWEPLIIGWVVALPDDMGFKSLKEETEKEMNDILDSHNLAYDLNRLLPKSSKKYEIIMYLELIGIKKSLMYPIHKATETLDKLRKYGIGLNYEINMTTISEVNAIARRDMVLNYYDKHHIYPKFKKLPSELEKYVKENSPVPRRLYKEYAVWGAIVFDKTFEFNYSPDQAELLKDSAAAPPLDAWGTAFDKCGFLYWYQRTTRPPSSKKNVETRIINCFLNSREDEVAQQFHLLSMGKPDENNHVEFSCIKEKELGMRAFTKQTYNQRLIQTSLEHNVSDTIFKYVPEQGMTDGEIMKWKRICDHVHRMLSGRSAFIDMDFIKWCLQQRYLILLGIGKMYDELFGVNGYYEESHNWFVDCNTFCNSRMHPPNFDAAGNPIPGEFFVNSCQGGREGMHQKKWTHHTICMLKLAMERCDLKGSIMGQGDNQVVIIDFTDDQMETRLEHISNFMTQLDQISRECHHELKLSETWYSEHLHEYGKAKMYKGMSVSNATQKASKCIPEVNDGLFAITTSVSTLNTITESAAKDDFAPDAAFLLNCVVNTNFLLRRKILNVGDRLNAKLLLLTPAEFGGLPTPSYLSHTIRGHDDKVSQWCSVMKTIQSLDRQFANRLLCHWQTSPEKPASDSDERSRLYATLYDLNIRPLPSVSSKIRDAARQFLMKSGNVTNPMIKRLYDTSISIPNRRIAQELDKMHPLFVPVVNVILNNTNEGLLERCQARFTSFSTINSICQLADGSDYIELVRKTNKHVVETLKNRLARSYPSRDRELFENECPTYIAEQLRIKSWGRELVGVTEPPYTHQVILKDVDLCTREELQKCINVQVSNEFLKAPKLAHFSVGNFQPYIGHSTQEKAKRPQLALLQRTGFSRSLLKLGNVRSWMDLLGVDDVVKVVDCCINEKRALLNLDDPNVEVVQLFGQIMRGNIMHRFMNDISSSFALINSLGGKTTHFKQSSNFLADRTGGGKDFTVFYQGIYVGNMQEICTFVMITGRIIPSIAAILDCKPCTKEVTHTTFEMLKPYVPISLHGSCYQLPTVRHDIQPTIHNLSIRDVMSYYVGVSLARNIDKNYRIMHNSDLTKSKLGTYDVGDISVNDMRMLDLNIIIMIACLASRHVQTLASNTNSVLSSISVNQSFSYFADLIIQSQRVEETVQILGERITEHSMGVTTRGLSSYIGRSVISYLQNNVDLIMKTLQVYKFHDNPDYINDQIWMSLRLLLLDRKLIEKDTNARLANKHRLIPEVFNHRFGVKKAIRVSWVMEETVTQWRRVDKTGLYMQPYVIAKATPEYNIRMYPQSIVLTYHTSRNDDNSTKLHAVKELSFIARPLGSISSSANKYVEGLLYFGLVEKYQTRQGKIISLAEGSGGTLSTLLMIFKNCTGMYNTLIRSDIDIRDDPVNVIPPAALNFGLIGNNRIIKENSLIIGETNILTQSFSEKLKRELAVGDTLILTMDAESTVDTTNYEFVLSLMPLIMEYNVEVIIFKLFINKRLREDINNLLSSVNSGSYTWYFFKPLSSNPIGHEILLFVIRNDDPRKRAYHMSNTSSTYEYMVNTKLFMLSSESVVKYFDATKQLLNSYKASGLLELVEISTIYDPIFIKEDLCGVFCKNFLMLLIDTFDSVHSHYRNPAINVVVRSGGTNECLLRLLKDILFLAVYHSVGRGESHSGEQLAELLTALGTVTVNDNELEKVRRRAQHSLFTFSLNDGCLIAQCSNAKHFFRAYALTDPCKCSADKYTYSHSRRAGSLWNEIAKVLRENIALLSKKLESQINRKTTIYSRVQCMESFTPNTYAVRSHQPRST